MRRLGGTRMVALVVAAVLGVSGGIGAALISSNRTEFVDPLGLGVPLVNVDCTGDTLIIVGRGDIRAPLSQSVVDWPTAKYLDTTKSCDTAYPQARGETPRYVAYLPAYGGPEAACEDRMTAENKGNFITRMRAGNEVGVNCACELELSVLPAIGEGQELTPVSSMWIYLYQGMLAKVPGLAPDVRQNFRFDEDTVAATRDLQSGDGLNPFGYLDADTWNVLRNKVCDRYDY
ncbi:MAG: hypothetical protein ABIQ15_12450 [Nocardioides sp.]